LQEYHAWAAQAPFFRESNKFENEKIFLFIPEMSIAAGNLPLPRRDSL
jgi:hypothetical protein